MPWLLRKKKPVELPGFEKIGLTYLQHQLPITALHQQE